MGVTLAAQHQLDAGVAAFDAAIRIDPELASGINVYAGQVTNAGVAEAHGIPLAPVEPLLPSR